MTFSVFSFFYQLWCVMLQILKPDRKWRSDVTLVGRTAVVTGGSSGIGRETVRDLASRGAKVIVGCRDTEKAENAFREMVAAGGEITVKKLDLASFASVRNFAEEVLRQEQKIHLLINNAGIAACPYWKTEDGFEMQFGVNHLGHFLLTALLLERLKTSAPARIVNVSSIVHYRAHIDFDDINLEKNYNPVDAYRRSKLANVLFTRQLAKKLEGTGVTTYCLHPGIIHTDLGRHLVHSMGSFAKWLYYIISKIFFKNVKDGARTTLYCAIDNELANESGYYYSGCRREEPSANARDDQAATKLWELSEKFTDVHFN